MANELYFMAFGALVAVGGFALVVYAKGGDGGATIDVFGLRLSLTSAGGILVIFLGCVIFALPPFIPKSEKNDSEPIINITGDPGENSTDSTALNISSVEPEVRYRREPLVGERKPSIDSYRKSDGWLSDAPTYNMWIQTGEVNFASNGESKKCVKAIASAFINANVPVDWTSDWELAFATEPFLVKVWCSYNHVIIIVAGPPNETHDKLMNVEESIKSALNVKDPA